MLWLSLYFPQLSLQIFSRGSASLGPLAISIPPLNRPTIYFCNQAARALGVHADMKVSAARALSQDLVIFPRNEEAENQALAHIATWAVKFTSLVSLAPPQALLLEIAGSLKFFGGLKKLLAQITAELQELGFTARYAVAPTPQGSLVLARARYGVVVPSPSDFMGRLNDLPIKFLNLNPVIYEALTQSGLKKLGEICRLPRSELLRRFNSEFLHYIDKITGQMPDPPFPYTPPPHFLAKLELPPGIHTTEAILFALKRLLLELTAWLRYLSAGTTKLLIKLETIKETESITLNLLRASRDPQHLLKLIREHIDNTKIKDYIQTLSLEVSDIQALAVKSEHLFEKSHDAHLNLEQLLERLSARLGNNALQGLAWIADHRPEAAASLLAFGSFTLLPKNDRLPLRPLWLLPQVETLSIIADKPCFKGELQFQAGPERIETGWWDGADMRRDYYIAQNPRGSRFWIYRDCRSGEWFLHGIFA